MACFLSDRVEETQFRLVEENSVVRCASLMSSAMDAPDIDHLIDPSLGIFALVTCAGIMKFEFRCRLTRIVTGSVRRQ